MSPRVVIFLVEASQKQLEINRARWNAWAARNPEKLKNSAGRWRAENRQHINAESRRWQASNLSLRRETNRRWREKNPEASRRIAREYMRKRYVIPQEKLKMLARNRVWAAITRGKGAKSAKTSELIGCTTAFLRGHLEKQFKPGMSWANQGSYWHLDHIRPCASFDLTDPAQQRTCFHFSNLQPLTAWENLTKGDTYCGPT